MADVDPYKLLDEVETKEQALKALKKASKAPNASEALEILVMAWGVRFHITSEDLREATK